MKIVSLIPSATEIVFALGLGDDLSGVTFECDYPSEARSKPVVSGTALPAHEPLTAREIDDAVNARVAEGEPIYTLDTARIRDIQPDLILAQDLCRVCAVPSGAVEDALEVLGCRADVLSLDPSTLDEVIDCVVTVGEATGTERRAHDLARDLRDRLGRVADRGHRSPPAADGRARVVRPAVQWRALGTRHDRHRGRRLTAGRQRRAVASPHVGRGGSRMSRRRRVHALRLRIRAGPRRGASSPRPDHAGRRRARVRRRRRRRPSPARARDSSTASRPSRGPCTRASCVRRRPTRSWRSADASPPGSAESGREHHDDERSRRRAGRSRTGGTSGSAHNAGGHAIATQPLTADATMPHTNGPPKPGGRPSLRDLCALVRAPRHR